MKQTLSRSLGSALICCATLFTPSCAVPLAPEYRIVRESREVRFLPGQPPGLQIHVDYKLHNSGTTNLNFVDMIFPEEKSFGRTGLRVEVNGHEVTPANLPGELQYGRPTTLRIPLDPPWGRRETRNFSVEYVLRPPQRSGAQIAIDQNSFYLGARYGFPQLQPPDHALSSYPSRPDRTAYTVRVPSDFLILARGASKGRKKDGGGIDYRFELSRDDLPVYVVAGRYVAWPVSRRTQSTAFWTLQPLKDDPTPAASRITAAWNALQKAFGPLDKMNSAPHIVESEGLHSSGARETGPVAASFPGGVLVNPAALNLRTNSDQFLDIVSHALAHSWFGDEMYFAPETAVGMGEGLPEYATIVIDEARSGVAARNQRVAGYLRQYDAALQNATEKPLGVITMSDPIAQRRIALAKAPLLYIALEDICGEPAVRAGLTHLLVASRGKEATYPLLRSAIELASSRNLVAPFHAWLDATGIPPGFRDRYPVPPTAEETAANQAAEPGFTTSATSQPGLVRSAVVRNSALIFRKNLLYALLQLSVV